MLHHPAARPTPTDPAHGPQPNPRTGPAVPGRPVPAGSRPPASGPAGPGTDPRGAGHRPEPATAATTPSPAKDLTINKVLAGAGAAATSAVLGSFFGAAGTVAGAALGSIASTVATAIYQRYLDRTRDTIVARIRPGARGTSPSELTMPMQRVPEGATVRMRVEPVVPASPPRRRRWWAWVGATVLVFVIGLLAVTGIEWAKGSTLTSNDSGTSVGRVLGGDNGTSVEPTTAPGAPADGSDATPRQTSDPSSTADPRRDRNGGAGSSDVPDTGAPSTGSSGSAGTTAVPGLSGLLGGSGSGGSGSGGSGSGGSGSGRSGSGG